MGCIEIQEFYEESRSKKTRKRRTLANRPTDMIEEDIGAGADDNGNVQVFTDDRVVSPGQGSSAFLNFVPTTKIKGMEDWLEEEDQFKYVKPTQDFVIEKQVDEHLDFPPLLRAFVFPRGDISRFPPPKRSSLGTSSTFDINNLFRFLYVFFVILLSFRLLLDGRCLPPSCVGIKPTTYRIRLRFVRSSWWKVSGHITDSVS